MGVHFSGPFLSFVRFVFGCILTIAMLLLTGRGFQLRDLRYLLLRGVFGAIAMFTFYDAIQMTSSGRATLLCGTYPIFVAVFGFLLFKEKIRVGALKVLVGTDAASTGLNLQRLGSLINLDLPWNPTILEQRKGRVQRGTISKRIPFCNLRYDEGVEQRLFNVLTGRIRAITDIFGTIPDFITDDWVTSMLEHRELNENDLVKMVTGEARSPFTVKETYEYLDEEWESTAEVLNSNEAISVFLQSW